MVAEKTELIKEISGLYNWLDKEISDHAEYTKLCNICGKCCDFENFGHLLFVTIPEILYLCENLGVQKLNSMNTSRCPYNINGKCTVYEYRFTGCRIFCCRGDSTFQGRLSESVISKIKSICTRLEIPYRYMPLKLALNSNNAAAS